MKLHFAPLLSEKILPVTVGPGESGWQGDQTQPIRLWFLNFDSFRIISEDCNHLISQG